MKKSARLLNHRTIRTPFFTATAIVGAVLFFSALILASNALSGNIFDGFIYITSGEGWPEEPTTTATDADQRYILTLRGLSIIVPTFGLILGWLPQWWVGFKCHHLSEKHSVICGLGWQGRAYAYANRTRPYTTVAIELKESPEATALCDEYNFYLIHGAADQPETLRQAGILQAKQLFICTGNQDLNLQIADAVKTIAKKRDPTRDPLLVHVSMGTSLADNASTDEMFSGLLGSDAQCHFNFYDPEQRMARIFFYQYPVYRWAQQQFRPDNLPVRVHLVFLGFNRLAGELILQYSRIWPCRQHQPPRFTILVADDTRAQRFVTRHERIFNNPPAGLDSLAQVEILTANSNEVQLLNTDNIARLSKEAMVTAVICCDDNPEHNLQRASHCRRLGRKLDHWHVPILVHIDKREGTDDLLKLSQQQIDPADRMLPFGSATDYCDLQLIDYMDGWARAIHQGYQSAATEIGAGLPSNRPWEELSHFNQASNYRATDHIPLKLYSVGYEWCGSEPWPFYQPDNEEIKNLYHTNAEELEKLINSEQTNNQAGLADPKFTPFTTQTITALSRLEHRSWLNEHRIEGFTQGVHDKPIRRTHPDITSWSLLTTTDQVKDLKQTITIAYRLATERVSPNAALPLRLILTGCHHLTHQQAKICQPAIEHLLDSEQLKSHLNQRWLELISPLAAGTDCWLTQTVLKHISLCCDSSVTKRWKFGIQGVSVVQPGTVPTRYIDDIHKQEFKQQRQAASHNGEDLWLHSKLTETFKHYQINIANTRRQILNDVNSHRRVHLYADGQTPLAWTKEHKEQLDKISKDHNTPKPVSTPAENISTAKTLANTWMRNQADVIIVIQSTECEDKDGSKMNKPLHSIDPDTGEITSTYS